MKKALAGFGAVAAFALVLALNGCTSGSNTPEEKIASISKTIKVSTQSAVALGLVAVPDEANADTIARETIKVMDESVWPILNGDEAGFIAALGHLRDLSVFDKPELAKMKLILEKALVILEANLPDDLAEKATDKIPADARAYITAFFEGTYNGAKTYLGEGDLKGGLEYKELRQKLAE